jgi:hypothetical protein
MNRSSRRNATTTTTTVSRPALARPVLTRQVTVVTPSTVRRARRRVRRSRTSNNSPSASNLFQNYINTLRDPFEYPAVRIGFGTMVPTSLYTAYYRGVFAANADGSFSLFQSPTLGTVTPGLYYNNSGIGSNGWVGLDYVNKTTLAGVMSECRIVSGGIRVLPQVPATSPPGIGYAGSFPSTTTNSIITTYASSLITSPHLVMGRAAEGACATCRPVDPDSFIFTPYNMTGTPYTIVNSLSAPLIVLTGLPASSTLIIEAMLNLESISSYQTAGQALTNPELLSTPQESLADRYSNIEQMFRQAQSYLPTSGQINTAASLVGAIGSVARRINSALRPRQAMAQYSGNYGRSNVRIEEV